MLTTLLRHQTRDGIGTEGRHTPARIVLSGEVRRWCMRYIHIV